MRKEVDGSGWKGNNKRAKAHQNGRKAMAQLLYQTLFEKGYITEAERNRLKNMIESRKPSANIK